MTLHDDLKETASALQRSDLAAAERAARRIISFNPGNADAWHLLALTQRRQGQLDAAEQAMRFSVAAAPHRAEFRTNFGNLLRARGRLRDAEQQYRVALELAPASRPPRLALSRLLSEGGAHAQAADEARRLLGNDARDAEAWAALGVAEHGLGNVAAAEAAYRRALQVSPDYAVARQNLGALLGEAKRAEESLEQLERAAALGARGPQLQFNRGRSLLELGRYDEAEAALVEAVRASPKDLPAQTLLAKLRYMRGDAEFSRDLAAAVLRFGDEALQLALGDLLRRAGELQGAEIVVRDLQRRIGWTAPVASALAVVCQESGRLEEALEAARRAAVERPDDEAIVESLVVILLQLGHAEEAFERALQMRDRHPSHHRWLAHQATAARVIGHPSYGELYDYGRFVKSFDLAPPPGYGTIEELHEALVPVLLQRHGLATHPLDQSLRQGTQTTRTLLADPDPVIRSLLAALPGPIEEYRKAIGHSDTHPYLARNSGRSRMTGCWSVKLQRGGYHVNHIHPEGWISSAYYVTVPPEVEDAEAMSGWIKFGEPRMPVPGAPPAHFVQPREGRLVLFPSYMWHGTTPILGDAPRMTVAFDVVAD